MVVAPTLTLPLEHSKNFARLGLALTSTKGSPHAQSRTGQTTLLKCRIVVRRRGGPALALEAHHRTLTKLCSHLRANVKRWDVAKIPRDVGKFDRPLRNERQSCAIVDR